MPQGQPIDIAQAKEVRRRYLAGQTKAAIAREVGISPASVTKCINDEEYGVLSVPVEARDLYAEMKVENEKIMDIKTKMMEFVEKSLDEAMEANNKHLFIDKFKGMLDSLDRIIRLNSEKPTSISEERTVKVDVAEVMKQLKTPAEQRSFLREQADQLRKDD